MKNYQIIIALLMIICVMTAVCACGSDEKHQHDYSADWTNDAKNHWHVCNGEGCDEIAGSTAHSFDEGVVTTPATEEAEGVLTKKCSVCGYEKTEAIAKLPVGHEHELQMVEGSAPTCVDKGVETYYTCSCGRKFSDEEGENEIAYPVIINEKGHTEVEFGEYIAPDCDTAGLQKGKKCFECDEVITEQKMISPLGHKWNEGAVTTNPTCYSEGVKTFGCTVCFAEKTEVVPVDANAHSWNDGVVTTKPTCVKEGEKTYTCTEALCGAKKTEDVPVDANAHVWDEGEITTPATCSAEGVKTFKCTLCEAGEKEESVSINPEAHSWNDGEITTAPTCTTEGVKTYTCKYDSNHKNTTAVDVDSNAHKASETWYTDGDNHWHVCENGCGNILDSGAHTPDREEATETDPIKCTACEYVIEPVKDHEHEYTILQYSDIEHWYKCIGCEEVDGKAEHSGGDAKCNAKAQCSVCEQFYGEVEADDHANIVIENAVDPDCINVGYTEDKKCTACNTVLSTKTEIPALGHKDEAVLGYAATCTTKGLSDGAKCSACGVTTVEQTEIEVRPHAWKNPVITVNGVVGTVTYECKDCDKVDQYTGPVAQDAHVCDHLVSGVETEYGKWTACSVCGAKSYAATALSAYSGSGATHASADVYLPKEGGNPTKSADMVKQSVKVSDVAVTYNLTSGADKSKDYVEFTYTIIADGAMTVNVFFNGRSTNTDSQKINQAAQINKFMELYQGDTKLEIPDSAVLPAYIEGYNYWTEQQVATVELNAGENIFTFRFTKNGGIYNGGKYYGAYASYFRFAEDSKMEGCEDNLHILARNPGSPASCTTDGVQMHYACTLCNKTFDYYTEVEVKPENLIIPAYGEHVYESIPREKTDEEGNKYYVYNCVRGCGATKEHTCSAEGKYLVIARAPNQVWYEEGDSFNPDRMELYLSNCAEGCGTNTIVAGHLSGYEVLSYTYQNGDSFKAGDTKITINYNLDEVTYSVDLPVTVVADGKTITVDNGSENFSYTNVSGISGDHPHNPGVRTNDQGKVGQSAYGGSYSNNFTDGDIAKFTFTLNEDGEANIVLRACTDRITSNIKYAYETIASEMMIIYIDGQVVNLDDSVVFNGSITNIEPDANRWTWTVWSNIDLGTYNLGAGEHTVEIVYNNVPNYQSAEGRNAHVQLDCLNVFLGQ